MNTVGVRELRQQASAVLRRVAAGETIVVTDRGRPVARLTPYGPNNIEALRQAGRVREALRPMREAPPPVAPPPDGPTAAEALAAARENER